MALVLCAQLPHKGRHGSAGERSAVSRVGAGAGVGVGVGVQVNVFS